jgi:hypothetical protein
LRCAPAERSEVEFSHVCAKHIAWFRSRLQQQGMWVSESNCYLVLKAEVAIEGKEK